MRVKILIITFEPTISMSFNIVLLLGITRAVGFLGTYFPAKCKRTNATCLLKWLPARCESFDLEKGKQVFVSQCIGLSNNIRHIGMYISDPLCIHMWHFDFIHVNHTHVHIIKGVLWNPLISHCITHIQTVPEVWWKLVQLLLVFLQKICVDYS